MKKLMIAAAIVCAAVVSQAAQVKWSSGVVTDSKGAAVTKADVIKASVYTMDAATYAIYATMDGETLSKTIATALDDGSFSKLGFTLDKSANNTYNGRTGAVADISGSTSYTAPTTAYGLIVYEDLNNEGWYMANVASKDVASAQDISVGELASKLGGGDASRGATAWAQASAVPEPTSGLLLLLGVAGLALRRRRA